MSKPNTPSRPNGRDDRSEDARGRHIPESRLEDAKVKSMPSPRVSGAMAERASVAQTDAASLLALMQQVASCTQLGDALAVLGREIDGWLGVDRVSTSVHEPRSDTMYALDAGGELQQVRTDGGLVEAVARTGIPVRIAHAGEDRRHDPAIDPAALDERMLAVSLMVGADRIGAMVAVRSAKDAAFTRAEQRRLERCAARVAPLLLGLLEARVVAEAESGNRIYRHAALGHHSQGGAQAGRPLEMAPHWLKRSYQVLLASFVVVLFIVSFSHHREYATGPAVIRVADWVDVTARFAGTASSIEVSPGQTVAEGQVLARFHDQREVAELQHLASELRTLVAARLRDPSDPAVARSMANLRAAQELAEARLEERVLRAPRDGDVADLRLRAGQAVQPGDVVLSLGGSRAGLSVIALLPGYARPQLTQGMGLRLELDGYRYAYQRLTIDRVGGAALGPAEALRLLPPAVADVLRPDQPVVFVHAHIPAAAFVEGGSRYAFHDGMVGRAEAQIRSRRLLFTLVPPLQALFDRGSAS